MLPLRAWEERVWARPSGGARETMVRMTTETGEQSVAAHAPAAGGVRGLIGWRLRSATYASRFGARRWGCSSGRTSCGRRWG